MTFFFDRKPCRSLRVGHYALMTGLLIFSPLAGAAYLGRPLEEYLDFPPKTAYVEHAPFSPLIFALLALLVAAVCLPVIYRLATTGTGHAPGERRVHPFPAWGWAGILIVLVSWILAWNRFNFFQPWQRYTFFPLWAGYILVVNALTCRRKGSCLARAQPGFFLVLFAASALFWWYFEYLNRFVRNWHYLTGGSISTAEYVLHATISFSTVLPAVLSTCELLSTVPRLTSPAADWWAVRLPRKKLLGWILTVIAVVSLALMAVMPDLFFPLVWISPLLVMAGIRFINGSPVIFAQVEQGNWQPVVLPALAALICGFFWEMWNWKSLAQWEYSVPYVHRYQLFAMPLLGYAGYLPFGLECVAAARIVHEIAAGKKSAACTG